MFDVIIIGGGIIGLATGYQILKEFPDKKLLLIEKEKKLAFHQSGHNSGVIHAGVYYSENSLKSKFCVEGNKLLYNYCKKNHVPYENTKKLIVASSKDQIAIIDNIKIQAEKNGVTKIKKISQKEVQKIEPHVFCQEALLVPSSGIIDAIAYMRSLVGKIEECGGMLAFNSKVIKSSFSNNKFIVQVSGKEDTIIQCNQLINSAGLFASQVASRIEGLDKKYIPETFFAKGNYFSINKDLGIRHLIYPIPNKFSLGIHLTPELDYSVKFGPDFEWVDDPEDYKVDINKKKLFTNEIKKYLLDFDSNSLNPSYTGIRPIIEKKDKSKRDFIIQTESTHSIPNLINLYGIESPGLTSSLALAQNIRDLLQ